MGVIIFPKKTIQDITVRPTDSKAVQYVLRAPTKAEAIPQHCTLYLGAYVDTQTDRQTDIRSSAISVLNVTCRGSADILQNRSRAMAQAGILQNSCAMAQTGILKYRAVPWLRRVF
jgi:hypothetical protein